MTYSDTPPHTPNRTLYRPPGLERLYELIDHCEAHALEVAQDHAEDPDFTKLARGVNALVQMQALIAKRVEADEQRRQREEGAGHTNIHTMKPFDAESLAKLHGDARALRALEAANDNVSGGDGPGRVQALDSGAAKQAVSDVPRVPGSDPGARKTGCDEERGLGPMLGETRSLQAGSTRPRAHQARGRARSSAEDPVLDSEAAKRAVSVASDATASASPVLRSPIDD